MLRIFELVTLGLVQWAVVRQGEVRIIEQRGKFVRVAQPGVAMLFTLWGYGEGIGRFDLSKVVHGPDGPRLIQQRGVEVISTRVQVEDYPKESIITRDNATVSIDAVVYYQVVDPRRAVYEVQDYPAALQKLVQSALRDECGKYELDELLTSRDRINQALRVTLDKATEDWGIRVERVELKDIDLGDFGRILAEQRATETRRRTAITEAEGEKRAAVLRAEGAREAAVLDARGQQEAAVLLAEGRKQAAILEAEADYVALLKKREAEAKGFAMLKSVFADGSEGTERLYEVLQLLKATEVAGELASGQATKIILPADVKSLFGLLERMGRT